MGAGQTGSPSRRVGSLVDLGGVKVPEPEREAQLGGSTSAVAATLEASPVARVLGRRPRRQLGRAAPAECAKSSAP